MVSCAETELPDPDLPPHLSGLETGAGEAAAAFSRRYQQAVGPIHARYNAFRVARGCPALPPLAFIGMEADVILVLAPKDLRLRRRHPLPHHVTLLDGCVRQEASWTPPSFPVPPDWPLVYVSFGSLAAMDDDLFRQLIAVFADMPMRLVMNVGTDPRRYGRVPDRMVLGGWFPQPSVIAQADMFLHHGGNNSVGEALYFGVPSLVMPYCWDGHDNATRLRAQGLGLSLARYDWTPAQLRAATADLVTNQRRQYRLSQGALRMQAAEGATVAATKILSAVKQGARPVAGTARHGL